MSKHQTPTYNNSVYDLNRFDLLKSCTEVDQKVRL